MRRVWLVVALLLAGGVVAAIVGYFAFGNELAEQFSVILFARGTGLSNQQAENLESDLKSSPNSFADRIELLSFYSFKAIDGKLSPAQLKDQREHILWIIEHKPASQFASDFAASFGADDDQADSEGTQQAKKLWLQQAAAHPKDSQILYNAGEFFFWSGDWPQSESLIEQATKIDPRSFKMSSSLARDYWHDANVTSLNEQRQTLAARSLEAFEHALDLAQTSTQRMKLLPDAARAAYEAGDLERATAWATEMLNAAKGHHDDANYSGEIHYGNIVLGLIAFQKGDVEGAGKHLVDAAAISGNPHLDTFGPNMMLAKQLIERGDRKPVLEYLESCGKFWKMGNDQLKRWHAEIVAGTIPDFGANLHY